MCISKALGLSFEGLTSYVPRIEKPCLQKVKSKDTDQTVCILINFFMCISKALGLSFEGLTSYVPRIEKPFFQKVKSKDTDQTV